MSLPSWPAHLTGRTRFVVLLIAIAGLVLAGRFIDPTSEAALQITEDTPTPTTIVVAADTDTPPAADTVVPSATETLPSPATDTATVPAPMDSPTPTQTTVVGTSTATPAPTKTPTPSQTPTRTPTLTPTPVAVQLPFSDGFESGTLANWTTIKGMTVQQADVLNGAYAARAASTGKAVYARTKLVTPQNSLYFRIRFNVVSKSAANVYILRFRSPTDTSLVGLYITSTGKLALRNDVSGVTKTSTVTVSNGVWHEVQVHVVIGASGQSEVWFDGTQVSDLSVAQAIGSTQIGVIQFGENSNGGTFTIDFDDIAADTSPISGSPIIPTPTATVPATSTPVPTATSTPVPTATFTAVATPTATAPATSTAIPVLPTNTPTASSTLPATVANTASATFTPIPTSTNTSPAIATLGPTASPTASATLTATASASATATAIATAAAALQGPVSFGPVADTYVSQGSPTQNSGTSGTLWVDGDSGLALRTYIRFSISGLNQSVASAKLWLYATNGSIGGPSIYQTSPAWSETGLTWNTAPAPIGNALSTVPTLSGSAWVSFDVSAAITGNGDIAFVLVPNSPDAAGFNSRQAASNQPRLELTLGSPTGPTATVAPPATSTATATVTPIGATATGTIAATVSRTATPSITPTATPPPGSVVVMAAGDIVCGQASTNSWCKQAQTAAVIQSANPDAVLALGDVQYECAEMADFRAYFDPTWGQFKGKIHPTSGNHEYKTGAPCVTNKGDAAEYYAYFGSLAGDPSKGYYSFNLGAWHIVALNSNCSMIGGCGAGSPQETWLRGDLAANPTSCTLAYMHYPRYSSVAPFSSLTALWQALYDNGAEIVLAAHDHHYERYGPRNATGGSNPTSGIVEFIVGTGGKQPNQSFGSVDSPVATGTVPGVLKLTLTATGYAWQFVAVPGYTYNDTGTGTCHGAPTGSSSGPGFASTGGDDNGGLPPTTANVGLASAIGDRTTDMLHAVRYSVRVWSESVLALLVLIAISLKLARTSVPFNGGGAPSAIVPRRIRLPGSIIAVLFLLAAALPGPAFAQAANVDGAPPQVTAIGSAHFPNLPPGPTTMAMARFTFDVGAELNDFEVPGPEILIVESGTITMGVRGETEDDEDIEAMFELLQRATPSAEPSPTPNGELFSYTMTTGDRLMVPPDMPHSMVNNGPGPASFLAAAITPIAPQMPEQPWPPAGIGQQIPAVGITVQPMSVGYNVATAVGSGAATLAIERSTFAPTATWTLAASTVPQLWYIEQGAMSVTGSLDLLRTAEPANAWSESAATPAPADTALAAGDAILIPAGAALTITSTGAAPIVATMFSVTSEGPVATPLS